MGAVFDAKTKVGRAVPDKGNDKVAPYCGNISTGAINSAAFLTPVSPGIDTEFIHEDCGKVVNGSITEHYLGSLKTTIDQNEDHTVNKNHTVVIGGAGTFTVMSSGSFTENQFGVVNRFFVMAVTEAYQQDHTVTVPDSFAFETKLYDNSFTAGTQINIVTGIETELVNYHVEVGGNHMEMKMTHPEVKIFKAGFHEGKTEVGLSQANIDAFFAPVGVAAKLKASVNALASIGLVTPFR